MEILRARWVSTLDLPLMDDINITGFDVVLIELFGTLCYGGTLVLKNSSDPFAHLKSVHATMATPSLLAALMPEDYGNLDTIVLAGEALPQHLADIWAKRTHLMNLYGPSEVSSHANCFLSGPGYNK